MSIAQLLSDKTSREASPEYADQDPVDSRSRPAYRQHVQDHRAEDSSLAGRQRYDERSPARYNESIQGPGHATERAGMGPMHSDSEQASLSFTNRATADAVNSRERPPTTGDYDPQRVASASAHYEDASISEMEHGDASSTLESADKTQNSPAQIKRRPKAEQDKRSAKAKMEDNDAPVEEKVKGKRGRKPKVNPNPLEGPAPPSSVASASSTPLRSESASKAANGGMKRQRGVDTLAEDRPHFDPYNHHATENGGDNSARAGPEGSDSDQEDFSQHKDLMSYMMEVHKRGQKVQKAYEKQSSVNKHFLLKSRDHGLEYSDISFQLIFFYSG